MSDPLRAPVTPLRVAITVLGEERTGIHRYARDVARALAGHAPAEIRLLCADLRAGSKARRLRSAAGLARTLGRDDVALLHYSRYGLWSTGRLRVLQLGIVLARLRGRAVVVLHDVYPIGGRHDPERWAQGLIRLLSAATIVHETHERDRLATLPGRRDPRVVPMIVVPRPVEDRGTARRRLGVDDDVRVLTLLGWIQPRKGHAIALEALGQLPEPWRLWCVGAAMPSHATLRESLERRAVELGVTERFEITGFVDDDALGLRIAATDIAVCPFPDASSSASAATWVAHGTPLVASDLPAFRALASAAPEAVELVDVDRPGALEAGVLRLARRLPLAEDAWAEVTARRSPQQVAARYLRLLDGAAGRG